MAKADSAPGQAKHLLLQGGIEHSSLLPSLPSNLITGATLDEKLLNAPPSLEDWYWIPEWLAGDWHRDEETVVSSHNYETGEDNNTPHTMAASERAEFGVQRDKLGGIWHTRLATAGVADCGSYLSVALMQSQEAQTVSKSNVVIKDQFTELHVNPDTKVIVWSAQAESITKYERQDGGTIKATTSIKFFDEQGQPTIEQLNESVIKQTKPFAATDTYKGRDLKELFKQFLISHNETDRIP
ncbi:MAG TPA: hypothetical protein V6C81_22715 [Planktothrix sp.]